jgi:hypothetical protein
MPLRRGRLRRAQTGASTFVPLFILMLALATWTGFQTHQLLREKETLAMLRANQEPTIQQAQRVRQTLDQLATETQKLADAGNPNARLVVEELRKRGVTINRPSQSSSDTK